MAQVIEVRFLNPTTGEQLYQAVTQTSSHRQAIKLAYNEFSGGRDEDLLETYRDPEVQEQGTFTGSGSNTAWRYIYRCVIANPDVGNPDLSMWAVLFAQYKEKGEGEEAHTNVPT